VSALLAVLFVLFSALMWRMRGGAFTTLTGLRLGTDAARIFGCVPAMVFGWVMLPVSGWISFAPLAVFLGLLTTGWAPFQEMGLQPVNMPEASWMRWLPEHLGFKIGTVGHDFIGMMQAGFVCLAPLAMLMEFTVGPYAVFVLDAAGLGFAPCYLLARLNFPTVKNFAEGQSWGEVFVGALIGAALMLIMHHSAGWSFL
jgi:hypothetical protein